MQTRKKQSFSFSLGVELNFEHLHDQVPVAHLLQVLAQLLVKRQLAVPRLVVAVDEGENGKAEHANGEHYAHDHAHDKEHSEVYKVRYFRRVLLGCNPVFQKVVQLFIRVIIQE